jgi:hypothetical protein
VASFLKKGKSKSRSQSQFKPSYLDRHIDDDWPDNIKGNAIFLSDNDNEGYYVWDDGTKSYIPIEYLEAERYWCFVFKSTSEPNKWVTSQIVPQTYGLGPTYPFLPLQPVPSTQTFLMNLRLPSLPRHPHTSLPELTPHQTCLLRQFKPRCRLLPQVLVLQQYSLPHPALQLVEEVVEEEVEVVVVHPLHLLYHQ